MSDKLAEYRSQLAQVEAAISADPDNAEWIKLRADLVEVISLTSELEQVKETAAAGSSKVAQELRTYSVGEKCQAIYEQDGQWYNAKIVALAEDGYFVTYLGFGNTAQVDFNEVRPYQRPDTSAWAAGSECSAVHASDGRWYEGTIVEVRSGSALVRFRGEGENAEVELDLVRLRLGATAERKAAEAAQESSKAAVPKSLEILPDDTAEVIEKKKKKLKMFKRQEKKSAMEQQGEGRRTSWQSFKGKNKTIAKSKNFHDPHWEPTKNHDEIRARQQLAKAALAGAATQGR